MAPTLRLEESGGGGRLKLELELQVRNYIVDYAEYEGKLETWERFGRLNRRPAAPAPPHWLALWFELQRWPGHLLVSGGLLDQPSWSWEMIDLAGRLYTAITEENRRKIGEEYAKKPLG